MRAVSEYCEEDCAFVYSVGVAVAWLYVGCGHCHHRLLAYSCNSSVLLYRIIMIDDDKEDVDDDDDNFVGNNIIINAEMWPFSYHQIVSVVLD